MDRVPLSGVVSLLLLASVSLVGCSDEETYDAHGSFEADEVTVSSEVSGQLLQFDVEEGDELAAPRESVRSAPALVRAERGAPRSVVGLVDTTRFALQRRELLARRRAVRAKMTSVSAEIDVLDERLRAARRELERVRTLRKGDAAPARQVDQAEDEVEVLERRIDATRTQTASLRHEIEALNERIAQVNERVEKSWVQNPVAGTVLNTFVEEGEIIRSGEPLYTIAALDTLDLRAYVSGAQLSDVTIGQDARVFIDDGPDARDALSGRVTWIADEAEFTPTPIQTKEERVDFVYAIKIRVANPDGVAKIGMPADVSFRADAMARSEP